MRRIKSEFNLNSHQTALHCAVSLKNSEIVNILCKTNNIQKNVLDNRVLFYKFIEFFIIFLYNPSSTSN